MGDNPLAVVEAWQDEILRLSSPEIEIVGPRGTARGHEPLRAWMGHARVGLTTIRRFARGGLRERRERDAGVSAALARQPSRLRAVGAFVGAL